MHFDHADSSIISKIKTELRESKGYIVNGRPKQSVQIVGDLFTRIKELAEQEVNASFTKVIITHPAQYELNKQTLLIESAKLSGFTDIILLEEPKAASYAFIEKHNIAVDSGAIVFDYGGGTIDVAYLYYNSEKNLDFKFAPESKPQCGGEYIDNVVHNYIQGVLGEGKSRLISPLLLANCSQMKINFKASDLETIVYNNTAIQFSREKFDKIIQEKVDEAITLLKDVKKICDDKSFPINYIFLNGGSSRLRTVQEKISAIFHDTKILEYGGDDLAVAIGAILYYKKNVLEDSIGSTRIDTVHEKPILCEYIDGRKEWISQEHLDSLQGNTNAIIKNNEEIKDLIYYIEDERLKNTILIDTPGIDAVVGDEGDSHQKQTESFLGLRRQHGRTGTFFDRKKGNRMG